MEGMVHREIMERWLQKMGAREETAAPEGYLYRAFLTSLYRLTFFPHLAAMERPAGRAATVDGDQKEEKGEQAGRVLTVLAIKVAQESVGLADLVDREARALVEPTG